LILCWRFNKIRSDILDFSTKRVSFAIHVTRHSSKNRNLSSSLPTHRCMSERLKTVGMLIAKSRLVANPQMLALSIRTLVLHLSSDYLSITQGLSIASKSLIAQVSLIKILSWPTWYKVNQIRPCLLLLKIAPALLHVESKCDVNLLANWS